MPYGPVCLIAHAGQLRADGGAAVVVRVRKIPTRHDVAIAVEQQRESRRIADHVGKQRSRVGRFRTERR